MAHRDRAHARKREVRDTTLVSDHAIVDARVLNSAILRTIPDLMFVLRKDGTYLSYHANDPKLLFAPPSAFIGKTIRQVMPRGLSNRFTYAIARALGAGEPVEVTYELPIGGARRVFEARLTACGSDRVVALVRDLTEIERARARSRDLAGRLIVSQELERKRIAREVHDDLGQKVSLLNIEIDRLVAPGGAVSKFGQLQKRLAAQVGEIANDLNQLAHQLHPSKVETLGIKRSIRSLCAEFSNRRKISASFSHGALPRSIDPNVSLCFYRIAQEALHNVFRHSRARHVSVRLGEAGSVLSLQIADDGVGFDASKAEPKGLGLIGMRERVGLLGGTLQVHSKPQAGTQITATVPMLHGDRRRWPRNRDGRPEGGTRPR
jgi:signal transduction histidine kinase